MSNVLSNLFGIPVQATIKEEEEPKIFLDRSTRCQAVQRVGVCGNPITNGGVNSSGFCEECWNQDIVTAHELYHACREDGMTRIEAIEKAMINTKDSAPAKPKPIVHVPKTNAVTDFDKDKHLYEGIGKTNPNFVREDL